MPRSATSQIPSELSHLSFSSHPSETLTIERVDAKLQPHEKVEKCYLLVYFLVFGEGVQSDKLANFGGDGRLLMADDFVLAGRPRFDGLSSMLRRKSRACFVENENCSDIFLSMLEGDKLVDFRNLEISCNASVLMAASLILLSLVPLRPFLFSSSLSAKS
ncbi:hypothetical protein [Burkholderia gladioli]|uniref:hypothetical protein n=1 Tax=Burkholderia gladioli TaxID=28095 RepID=UPI001C220E54|nr:hypothetical protein [Burkholderia gladioli]